MGFFVGSKLAQSAESQINAGMLQTVLSCGPEELDACMLDFESVGLTGAQNGVKLGGCSLLLQKQQQLLPREARRRKLSGIDVSGNLELCCDRLLWS